MLGPEPASAAAPVAGGLHHHLHGSQVDYLGVGLASFASWVGVPGPGEAVLIAAGVLAAHHRLDLGAVVTVAWLGASLGGVAGWLIGLFGGRALVTVPGPFRRARAGALRRGERFFERYGVLAVFFTPSWVAGVNQMRWPPYMAANAVSALLWAIVIGTGAYLVGPSVADIIGDLGLVSVILLGLVALALVGGEIRRRQRRGAR
jgi:membrane protein DedA with SNARE-associated domain